MPGTDSTNADRPVRFQGRGRRTRIHECDARIRPARIAQALRLAEAGKTRAIRRSDVEIVAEANDPDGDPVSRTAAASERLNFGFFRGFEFAWLVAPPCLHARSSPVTCSVPDQLWT